MSDIQTVKVAEEYAKHDLLKHFAIPRMRIDDVEMTIPVALDQIEEKTETVYQPIDHEKFNSFVYNQIVSILGLKKLPAEASKRLRIEIAKQTQTLEQDIQIAKNLTPLKNYGRELANRILALEKDFPPFKRDVPQINIEALPEYLEKTLSKQFKIASQTKSIDNLNVMVEAHRLREQKPENIIYIKLKISEDSMEWNRTETGDGEVEAKLLPE